MTEHHSIADARCNLPRLIREAERGKTMQPSLSKSRFQHGLQCLKRLYLESYQRDLADPVTAGLQARFDMGNVVGETAHRRWPGGVLVDESHLEHVQAAQRTRALLDAPAPPPIFEAAFTFERIRVRVDILAPNDRGGFDLVEVKSTARVKGHHVTDVAIQTYVVEGAGVTVDRVFLMHLDKEYVYQGGDYDPASLFTLAELTQQVRAYLDEQVALALPPMWDALRQDAPPDVPTGPHCKSPYPCRFFGHCHRDEPEHPARTLPDLHPHLWHRLRDARITDIGAIPPDLPGLSALQRRVRKSVVTGRPSIGSELGPRLRALGPPVSFLDVETFMAALPVYAGARPFQTFPFQWSLHVRDAQGALDHREFLNTDGADPRERFASALLDAVPAEGPVLAYSGYELRILRELAEAFPAHRDALSALAARIVDLLPIVRSGYYHPAFRGSFSIKSVLPALVPEFGYGDLDIADGETASTSYLRMIAPETPDAERDAIRGALLAYCRRDTEAMVRVVDALLAECEG